RQVHRQRRLVGVLGADRPGCPGWPEQFRLRLGRPGFRRQGDKETRRQGDEDHPQPLAPLQTQALCSRHVFFSLSPGLPVSLSGTLQKAYNWGAGKRKSRPTKRGRPGFDRVLRGMGGVSWLISWPRKKLITLITAEPQFSLAA